MFHKIMNLQYYAILRSCISTKGHRFSTKATVEVALVERFVEFELIEKFRVSTRVMPTLYVAHARLSLAKNHIFRKMRCKSTMAVSIALVSTCLCMVTLAPSYAFLNPTDISFPRSPECVKRHGHLFLKRDDNPCINRREFGAGILATWTAMPSFVGHKANAAMMEQSKDKFFESGVTLSVDVAKTRFQEARHTMVDLINNFETISKEGGDNVRRYLGTVGTTSAMYGIEKVMKDLQPEAVDIVEYTENMGDFVYYLRAADTAAYSANFVEFSTAKTKPEKLFADAKSDCKNLLIHMNNMAVELKL